MSIPPPLPHEQILYLSKDGITQGPFSRVEINQMLERNEITMEILAWKDGLAEWQPLRYCLAQPIAKNTGGENAAYVTLAVIFIALLSVVFIYILYNASTSSGAEKKGAEKALGLAAMGIIIAVIKAGISGIKKLINKIFRRGDQPVEPNVEQKKIHIMRNGEQLGPYSIDDTNGYLRTGALQLSDLAWHEGLADWIQLSSVPGIASQAISQKPGKFYSYDQVPWFRRSGINSLLVILGLFLGIFLLFPVGVLISGDVYYNKANPDGTLKKWSVANKIAAVIILLFWVVIFFAASASH